MKRNILNKEKTVTGINFWGFNSSITFLPAGKPGWYMRTPNEDVPIDHKIAYYKKGRLQLKHNGVTLEIIEHIISLKMLIGLDEVILVINKKWPPYLGGAGGYAKQLEGCYKPSQTEFETIEPTRSSVVQLKNKISTSVSIEKQTSGDLEIRVHSHWHPIPPSLYKVELESFIFLNKILNSKPQGFPFYREYFADLITFFGWGNKDNVSWRSDFRSPYDVSYSWWCHAVQDCLGEIALCHHQKIPVAKIMRWCAGHKQMLEAIKQSFS